MLAEDSNSFGCLAPTEAPNFFTKQFPKEQFQLQLWDFPGDMRFFPLAASLLESADVCVLVYDAERKETFDTLHEWKERFCLYNRGETAFIELSTQQEMQLESKLLSIIRNKNNFDESWSKAQQYKQPNCLCF